MKKNNSFFKKFLFFIFWILFSAISILVAYWVAGAIPDNGEGLGFGIRFVEIIQLPFEDYFNDYSPIAMVLAFIINEIIFGIIYISKFSFKNNAEEGDDVDVFQEDVPRRPRINQEIEKDYTEEKSTTKSQEFEWSEPDEEYWKKLAEKDDKSKKNIDEDKEEKEFVMDDGIFLKMFNAGYDMNQITAMMELTQYIPKIDDIQLKKMFKPNMSSDEIREYIEVFYG